jgi:hypothetical protein
MGPSVQAPAPSHAAALVRFALPLHAAGPHAVPTACSAHCPAPSQRPFVPHVAAPVTAQSAWGSAPPAGTGAHVPAEPGTLHALQVAQLAVEQQTPSTQKLPVKQSDVWAQACPSGFLSPHRFVARSHRLGAAQASLDVHAVLHAVPLQANGAQDSVLAARHAPAPSQLRANVSIEPPAAQEGAAQIVPAAYSWQAPLPSQTPVVPQLVAPASVHVPVGSVPPEGTGAHVPSVPESAHDVHVPAHAVRQQTPWAHWPSTHSAPSPQAAPGGLSPHEPFTHVAGEAQSASAVHVALHAAVPHL